MSELIEKRDAYHIIKDMVGLVRRDVLMDAYDAIKNLPTIDAVPIKFIDEVIEYLEKCRDYAIHEETKTAWNDEAVALIMLLHEWDAWNECGRTGKYGERREG